MNYNIEDIGVNIFIIEEIRLNISIHHYDKFSKFILTYLGEIGELINIKL